MAKCLVGFMGSGKSTLAKSLSDSYIDMDECLEDRFGMPISSYFKEKGEQVFRQQESQLLEELLSRDEWISTGGGVVISERNRELLKKADEVIYLKADFETLYQRVISDMDDQRPLVLNNSKEELKAIFESREKWYEEVATKIILVDGKNPNAIIEELI